jgi:hypothetical protein
MSVSSENNNLLDDETLQSLYTWVDEIPLSRPKRNITRDFSDGGACGGGRCRGDGDQKDGAERRGEKGARPFRCSHPRVKCGPLKWLQRGAHDAPPRLPPRRRQSTA